MKQLVASEIKNHPLLYIALTVICTAVTVFGTSTFATMGYVDRRHNEARVYVNEKDKNIRSELKEIKEGIKNVNTNILNLYKERLHE